MMNRVEYLSHVRFSTLEQKLEIKRLGPHRPTDLIIIQEGKDKNRSFNQEWYKRKKMLVFHLSHTKETRQHCP